MSDAAESSLYHLPDPPTFEFDDGQAFTLAGDEDPDEYWYVRARVWNYDARVEDFGPTAGITNSTSWARSHRSAAMSA